MNKDYAIEFEGVSKTYSLKTTSKKNQEFYALKEISFKIPKGEVVGVLGTNGSGKSTLSMILSGISEIDEGKIVINGKQALIAINTGLNAQLTGYENIELKGALLGLTKKRIKEITQGVIDFAELGDFLYQPVKKYSSGMKSRLGFSINMCLNPDIIIVDEALSVGDKGFANKCIKKMRELKEDGKTIIFISHSLTQVKSFCDTALWIEGGILQEYGEIREISKKYELFIEELNGLTNLEKKKRNELRFTERLVNRNDKKLSLIEKLLNKNTKRN